MGSAVGRRELATQQERGLGHDLGLESSRRHHGNLFEEGARRQAGPRVDQVMEVAPRTGLPARTGLEEVSVVASTGLEAEVVAKTALLMGRELAPLYCAAHAMAWWLA